MITVNGYNKDPNIIPEAIALTFGQTMIKEQGGLRIFIEAFQDTMTRHEEGEYWMHTCSNLPKIEVDIIYIIVVNRLWGRVYNGGYQRNHDKDVIGYGATGEQKLMDKPFII